MLLKGSLGVSRDKRNVRDDSKVKCDRDLVQATAKYHIQQTRTNFCLGELCSEGGGEWGSQCQYDITALGLERKANQKHTNSVDSASA